jgi:hypothetical protein
MDTRAQVSPSAGLTLLAAAWVVTGAITGLAAMDGYWWPLYVWGGATAFYLFLVVIMWNGEQYRGDGGAEQTTLGDYNGGE